MLLVTGGMEFYDKYHESEYGTTELYTHHPQSASVTPEIWRVIAEATSRPILGATIATVDNIVYLLGGTIYTIIVTVSVGQFIPVTTVMLHKQKYFI